MGLLQKSLTAKLLTYFLLLSIVPLILTSFVGYDLARRLLVSHVRNHFESVAILKEQAIVDWVEHLEHTMTWLSTNQHVQNDAATLADHEPSDPRYLAAHGSLVAEFTNVTDLGHFWLISLLDADTGKVVASMDADREGTSRADQRYFTEGKSGTYVSEVFQDATLGRVTMVVSAPVKDGSGRLVGVLEGHANLEPLNRLMQERSGLGETGDTFLVRRDYLLVTDTRFEPGAALKKSISDEGVRRAMEGKSGVGEWTDYRGKPVIGDYRWLGDLGLVMIAKQDRGDALAMVDRLRNLLIAVVGVMAAFVALVCALFARSINRPVRQLVQGTQAIARGNLGYRVVVKTRDEIGQLAEAFNRMAGSLQESSEGLRHSEERYRAMFENAGEAITTIDRADVILSWNRAAEETFGYKAEEVIGKTYYHLVPPDLLEKGEVDQLNREVLERGSVIRHQTRRTRKDGSIIDVALTRSALRDAQGNIIGFMAIIADITERKQMQERLLAAERLATMGQLSGNISHELRNPLGVIDSSAFYLKTRLKDADAKVQEHLDRIRSSVRNATAVIQSLVDLTRMKQPQLERVDIREVAADAVASFKVPAEVSVTQDYPEGVVLVSGDREQLRMAFQNIVKNALQAMEGGGKLTSTILSTADGQAEVSFADTGPGIAPENLEKVFQPLFSTRATGMGFGLSLTRMIIERHGGTIKVQSPPGRGVVFVVRLPLYQGRAGDQPVK